MRAIERKVYILLTKEQFNNENFKINWNDLVTVSYTHLTLPTT